MTRKRQRQFGSIRELPSGKHQARYLAPDGRIRSAPNTFDTKKAAAEWLSTIQASVVTGDWRPPEPAAETLGSYGRRWLDGRFDIQPRTRELYESLWKRWLEPGFAGVTLGALTVETIRTWHTKAMATHPGSTQPAKAYRLVRAMLNTALDDGLIRANPCRVKGAGQEHAPERPVVMPDVVVRLAEGIDSRYRAMVLLAAFCSMRYGELAGLRRGRIDVLHRTVSIDRAAVELRDGSVTFGPPKSAAGRRVVTFPAELVPIIEAHLEEYVDADPGALVFTSPEGHPLRRSKFRPRWSDACDAAGITGLHFHDLRGSGATWAAVAGATVRELMSRLGHASPAVAMRYQHATLERDRVIADRLGALLRVDDETVEDEGVVVPLRP